MQGGGDTPLARFTSPSTWGGVGTSGVPRTLAGGTLAHPSATALSQLLGVPHSDVQGVGAGYGSGTLQRWLMQALFNRVAGESGAGGGPTSAADGVASDDEGDATAGAFDAIIRHFAASLGGLLATSWLLGLAPAAPGRLHLAPSGHLSQSAWADEGYAAKAPVDTAPLLHDPAGSEVDGQGSTPPPGRFASRALCGELLAVLGQRQAARGAGHLSAPAAGCLQQAVDALMALRSAAGELAALYGAWGTATGALHAGVSESVAGLRCRLLVHLADDAARAAFTQQVHFAMHLDA